MFRLIYPLLIFANPIHDFQQNIPKHYIQHLWNASKEYANAGLWWKGLFQPESTPLIPSVEIFNHNDAIQNIHCFRIPSIVGDGQTLYAFAEAREDSCDDCAYSRIVLKTSLDFGKSWSPIHFITHRGLRAKNPTSLYDNHQKKIVVHYMLCKNTLNGTGQCVPGFANKQASSYDGIVWTIDDITLALYPYEGVFPGPGNAFYDAQQKRYLFPAHFCTAYRSCGKVFVYYSDDHGLTYSISKTKLAHMDEATISRWNESHLVLNMRTNHSNATCNCRALSFSNDSGITWSEIVYESIMKDSICEGSSTSFLHFTYFINPSMYFARSNLTLFYKSLHQTQWQQKRITNEFAFSDYSSLLNIPIVMNGQTFLGVMWGSCTFPLPFRVWCAFDKAWNIRFGWVSLDT